MPRTKKPAGQAVDPRNGRTAELTTHERDSMPMLPRGLKRKGSRELWHAYWSDVISGLVHESETMIVERWIRNVDRYNGLMDRADRSPVLYMKDDEGEVVRVTKHPSFEMAMKLEVSIRADEAQIGYGPKNRAALGIAVVQQQSSLAEMNKRYGATSFEDQPDPRMTKEQ